MFFFAFVIFRQTKLQPFSVYFAAGKGCDGMS